MPCANVAYSSLWIGVGATSEAVMSAKKIQSTKDYRQFGRHNGENRPIDIKKHKRLQESMKLYGFLECFPIVCIRDSTGKLVVKDGQHRLMIAESLGLPVHYVVEDKPFDVAIVNSTAKVWTLIDYAQKFSSNGHVEYTEAIEFSKAHRLPIGTAVALLSGTTSWGNVSEPFMDGTWKVKDRQYANAVASVYSPMVALSASLRNARFIEACMAACRVKSFNGDRLVANAQRCREKLVNYSTRDAYLDMMEAVYNFGRKELVGLKAEAIMTMRNRNATTKAKLNKEQKRRRPPEADAK